MKVFVVLAIALVCAFAPAQGKVFTKCGLAQALYAHGIPKADLANWVCLVQHESSFNTAAVGALNSNGTRDYGLFQINNKYWCKGNISSYNECNVACSALLSDDITGAVNCAKKIKAQQGFKAWYGWLNHCQGALPSINECF
ncbi:unnamed protein product [Hermetia illucens]|uniref:lysozyme n=1 Tax=Hermetia illucens TaxID=343691 RepID=A0A7R8UXD9_HERIL|nr:lysozyme 1-like [Hermetia illucens]CAD7088849.1 unnamed protein product [Hermetia illucens]